MLAGRDILVSCVEKYYSMSYWGDVKKLGKARHVGLGKLWKIRLQSINLLAKGQIATDIDIKI